MASARRRHSEHVERSHKRAMSQSHRTMTTMQTSPGERGRGLNHQPLRRGDACLMCRAKKLKCSATKPTCDQCSKRKDRCVYDAIRPASRVEKLEKKLAEMEEEELRSAMSPRRRSSNGLSSFGLGMTPTPNLPQSSGFDYGMFQFQPPAQGYAQQPTAPDIRPASMPSNLESLNSWSWPNQSFVGSNNTDVTNNMSWSLLSSSNDVSTFWSDSRPNLDSSASPNSLTPQAPLLTTPALTGNTGFPYDLDTFHPGFPNSIDGFHPPVPPLSTPQHLRYLDTTQPVTTQTIDDVLSHASDLRYQLEEKDISQAARDYLLDLYFSEGRRRFGSEVWSEDQFRGKMSLPINDRPHPCLLFSLYTQAASASYIPAVRALADSLYSIANVKVQEAIGAEDRLLDAINASKQLGKWLFSKGRALEGWLSTSRAMSLALACQLHKIKSSIFAPHEDLARPAEDPKPLLNPPKSQWDLAERIHLFWACYGGDRGASVLMPWPTLIPEDIVITTPLPREPTDYLDGTIHKVPDFYIKDIYLVASRKDMRPPNYVCTLLIIASHLLHRARKLSAALPENRSSYTALAHSTPSNQPYSARRDHPVAYKEIMNASWAIERKMPEHMTIKMTENPPWSESDVPLTHACLLVSRMLLHPLNTDTYDLSTAMSHARQLSGIIRIWSQYLKVEEMKEVESQAQKTGKWTTRAKHGLGGPYLLSPWLVTADRLVKGTKILRSLGREQEARDVEEDGKLVITALKDLGVHFSAATELAKRLEKASKSP